jgi:hypothetical protein
MTEVANAQNDYISKSAYKADITYLEKLESSAETEDLLSRLKEIYAKSALELDAISDNNTELEKLKKDVRDFIKPRSAIYNDPQIEQDISNYLLKLSDMLIIEGVNLQNKDWKLSAGGTYKYYEFDAVGKNVVNFYVLINGYYKVEIKSKRSRNRQNGPYVYVAYKRTITYKNDFHHLIRN